MNINSTLRIPLRTLVVAGATAALLLGFGAGSSAGIQGSGRFAVRAFGRITAFGSIFVDGVEYEIAQAQIELDGNPAKTNQLEVGQVVLVQGDLTSADRGIASSVSYTSDVVGPASRVDVAGATFAVLGQQVKVDSNTVYGDGLQPASVAGIPAGTSVKVSGLVDASGNLEASRIDLAAAAPLQVKGTVQTLDGGAQTFRINDLVIDYSGVTPTGKLVNGSTATVQAVESPSNGTLHATLVQASMGIGGIANQQGQLEGFITSISSNSVFFVGDQEVITNAATHFVLHGQTISPDLTVKVIGTFDGSGALVAKTILAHPKNAQ